MANENLIELARRYSLVLGSGSPRRLRLLEELGIPFERIIPDLAESRLDGEPACDLAVRLASEKAIHVATNQSAPSIVIGCDTIVILEEEILGKPKDAREAIEILGKLSGRQHVVCSAIALTFEGSAKICASGYELTNVYFHSVDRSQIEEYVASGEPLDKAGAYGIQDRGLFLVDRIDGNLDNVVGLPRTLLNRLAGEVLEKSR